ncbi:hypothetical protein PG994_003999 [Apiospora phragmitis]|uniref:NACHT domain-containing protein n=1 Tax=Apiospora phragmitis TaxID=2905665 RepID=A0ABR1VZP9_9PEZI
MNPQKSLRMLAGEGYGGHLEDWHGSVSKISDQEYQQDDEDDGGQSQNETFALGVASNILAVIYFAWTVLTEARSIHNSSSGLSGEAEFVDLLVQDVAALDGSLPSIVDISRELQTLLTESKNIIALLQKALQAVKTGNPSKWSSFLSALKQTWGKDQVKGLTSKLGSLQLQVIRHLQIATQLDIKRGEDFQELQRNLVRAIEESTRSGRDIATSINDLAAERQPSQDQRSKVLIKLADFRKLEVATKAISESAETARADQQILGRLHFDNLQLENRNGVFWVYGKPGSGKSTFMKFLCGNRDTRRCLQRWAGQKELIVAKSFFWYAGSALQKSQEGLLRSLLFEILRQCPELMPAVTRRISEMDDWDLPDALQYTHNLLILYRRIVTQDILLKFCFFVDGLDEFQEERRVVRLKLEDLTRDDIQQYVSDKLIEHAQFKTLTHMNPEYSQVVDAVVIRAQGVFLWVYLVVRDLLQGLTYHDSASTLYRRLREFPPDLESFSQHLIDSVEPIYRKQMAQYFKIATLADEPLPAMMYSYLDDIDDNPDYAIVHAQSITSSKQLRLRHEQLRRRLDGRSRGLLELVNVGGYPPMQYPGHFFEYGVDFLHRTVRDFLRQSADVQSSLQHGLDNQNFSLTASHAILAVMKTVSFPYDETQSEKLVRELFLFVSSSLVESPGSETALENILKAAETSYRITLHRKGQKYEAFFFLGLAARIDFFTYVYKRLVTNPNMLQEAQGKPITRNFSTRTVTRLLEAGADSNEAYEGSTVWQCFLNDLYHHGTSGIEGMRELIRMLILHDADLSTTFSFTKIDTDRGHTRKSATAK